MAIALATLLPELRVELPGVPEPLLAAALARITRQYFRKSETWKFQVSNVLDWTTALTFPVITPGTDIPADTHVVRIDTVKYKTGGSGTSHRTVRFKTRDQLDRENPDWETEVGSSPSAWTKIDDSQAVIVPIASADVLASLTIRTIIAPDPALLTIPDFLFYESEETIKQGVLAQIMKVPGKDWTNINLAVKYKRDFNEGVEDARSKAQAEYGQPFREVEYGGIPTADSAQRRSGRRDDFGSCR